MLTSTVARARPIALLLLVVLVWATSTTAQEWAKARLENSPRHLEFVKVKREARVLNCFVAYPEVAHKAHAVVVIHDISGMGEWIRGIADQLAEAGYIAIVPDLLSGMGPKGGGTESFSSIDEARRAIPELPPEQIKTDLDAAADYMAKLPAAKGTVSIAGFCWGGGQALRYATNNSKLSSAYVFYGYEPIDLAAVERLTCPVYGFYAENDARIDATIPGVQTLMEQAKKRFEPVIYNGAGHGFMRHGEDPGGSEPNRKARNEAWERWKKLLKNN